MLPSHPQAAGPAPSGAGPDAAEAEIRARQGRHLVDYASLFARWWRTVAVVAAVPAVALSVRALVARPVFSASAQVLVDRQVPQLPEFRDLTFSDVRGDEYYLTQVKLMRSQAVAERAARSLPLASAPEFAGLAPDALVGAFRARIDAERQEQSQFVTVSFESSRPELAAAAANAVAEAYVEEGLRIRAEAVAQAASGLAAQIGEQQRTVAEAEAALLALGEREGVVSFEERRALLEQKMRQLGVELTGRKVARLQKEAVLARMKAAPDPQALPAVVSSKVVQDLRVELSRLERREADLLSRFMDRHPEVVRVRAELAEARRRMALEAQRVVDAAESDYLVAAEEERSVTRAVQAAQAEALDLGRRGVRYEQSRRELEARRSVLTMLLGRARQADVARDLRLSPIRIVDRAVAPRRPVRPRLWVDALLGGLLGLAMGLGAALVLDRLDGRLLTRRDVNAHLQLPVLAEVPPRAGSPAGRVLREAEAADPFAESYRTLRASLDAAPGGRARVVALVSAAPREGKTLTAANLALALSARGEETLLVDADLRDPEAHRACGTSAAPGLADVLAGRLAAFEAVQPVDGSRLRLLPAGNVPASPSDALRPDALDALLAAARERYRWIVVDTPPLSAAADAIALARRADAVVLVVGAGVARRQDVVDAMARLRFAGALPFGVVLNRAAGGPRFHQYGVPFRQWRGGGDAARESPAASELARTG
jgi:capsular exopolysaccharide synthesis family protein